MNNYFNSGLNDEEVIKSRKKYGSNSIVEKKQSVVLWNCLQIQMIIDSTLGGK